MRTLDAQVIIVGAGPAGLLLACELGARGTAVILVEEKCELPRHPRANTQSARSMEIYRRHSISKELRRLGLPPERNTDVAYFDRLFGHELHRVPLPSPRTAERLARSGEARWPTPEPQYRITQMAADPVLLKRASSFPNVDIRFGCKAVELQQDDSSVRLTTQNAQTGQTQHIDASFLVGCDGGRSFVRKALGIRFLGEGGLEMEFLGGRMLATYFRAPTLLARFPHADTWMHWIMHPHARSILLLLDADAQEFLLHFQLRPDEVPANIDFAARLEAIVGETLPHQVISSAEWRAGVGLVAERYRERRCFLVGDSVHLFTPTGGFGLNTGIEDAFNLGWKLAAVLSDRAGYGLLDTYQIERLPIAHRNTRYALELAQRNGSCPVSAELDSESAGGEAARAATREHLEKFARWEFDTPGVQLGARYNRSPIIVSDGAAVPPDSPTEYQPSGVPGGRLPHAWLKGGDSLFDRLGPEFTLLSLTMGDTGRWRAAAAACRIPLEILDLPQEPEYRRIVGGECLLIRPDQHIAWRGAAAADAESVLRTAAGL
jgi:2-polyprenyl-6-methoxyphenol hydroxylase-like FAD-dependent oxidoreductase